MPVITDYNSLISNVQALAEDDGTEFALYVPTAIDLAEERIFKEMDLPDLEIKATGALSTITPLLAKPTGYVFPHYFNIVVSGLKKELKKRTEEFINDYWPNSTSTDVPKYYADSSQTNFVIAPTPSSTFSYEIKYSAKPAKLSVSNGTNYYTANCQDILYAAVMVEMAKFMKAWTQTNTWEQTYGGLRDDWNLEMMRKRRDDAEMPNNPQGGTNTLKQTSGSNA